MKRGTPEYEKHRREVCKRADEQLADALTRFTYVELLHDWSCNIGDRARQIMRSEFQRRGILPPLSPTHRNTDSRRC